MKDKEVEMAEQKRMVATGWKRTDGRSVRKGVEDNGEERRMNRREEREKRRRKFGAQRKKVG